MQQTTAGPPMAQNFFVYTIGFKALLSDKVLLFVALASFDTKLKLQSKCVFQEFRLKSLWRRRCKFPAVLFSVTPTMGHLLMEHWFLFLLGMGGNIFAFFTPAVWRYGVPICAHVPSQPQHLCPLPHSV